MGTRYKDEVRWERKSRETYFASKLLTKLSRVNLLIYIEDIVGGDYEGKFIHALSKCLRKNSCNKILETLLIFRTRVLKLNQKNLQNYR